MRALVGTLCFLVVVLGVQVLRLGAQVRELQDRPAAAHQALLDCPSRDEVRALRHQVKEELTSIRTRLNWDEATECPKRVFNEALYNDANKALATYNANVSPLR